MSQRRLRALFCGGLATLLCCAAPRVAHAGAWTREPYHFYLQLGTAFTLADRQFNSLGDKQQIQVVKNPLAHDLTSKNISNYQQLLSDLYFEVGLLSRLTIFGDLAVLSARQKNPGGDLQYSATGFADMMLGARVGLVQNPLAVALEARLTFPTGSVEKTIPLGSGGFSGELRVAFGKSFSQVPLYFDVEFGVNMRGAGRFPLFNETYGIDNPKPGTVLGRNDVVQYSPELVLHAELGATLVRWHKIDRLLLSLNADYRGSTNRSVPGIVDFSLFPAQSQLTTVGAALFWYAYRGFGVLARFNQAVQGERLPVLTTAGAALFVAY